MRCNLKRWISRRLLPYFGCSSSSGGSTGKSRRPSNVSRTCEESKRAWKCLQPLHVIVAGSEDWNYKEFRTHRLCKNGAVSQVQESSAANSRGKEPIISN